MAHPRGYSGPVTCHRFHGLKEDFRLPCMRFARCRCGSMERHTGGISRRPWQATSKAPRPTFIWTQEGRNGSRLGPSFVPAFEPDLYPHGVWPLSIGFSGFHGMLPMQTNSTANSALRIIDLGLNMLFRKPLLLSTIQHKPECYESTAYSIVLNPAF